MWPQPGQRLQRFVGDRIRFTICDRQGHRPAKGWKALLRTNLGRAEVLRREILESHTRGLPPAGASWRDLPMVQDDQGWHLELPLAEVGYFKAKAYLVDPRGWQHWPEGRDFGVSVHPDFCRTANLIYCAFTRMFGPANAVLSGAQARLKSAVAALDAEDYSVVPPSGKLRDLTACLPHIVDTLGCRIIQLLPVNPTPTTYARFGRYGSPYAALDLTAIDPALVVFDQRTTGIDQFCELTSAAHLRGARVFLDIVINHTGWGSVLQERHPEWFLREENGRFVSPGAWGTTWEDLVELQHQNVALWDELAEIFLTWCRRGVDGFRCDAGYKVPVAAWQYIIARVQQEFPEVLFLLEGLGGAWKATEDLLTEGGMQWAYSELFQNYSGEQLSGYLDHSFQQTESVGLLVHYSETHDNERLAKRGRTWSLLRNRLCALTSMSGGFAFTGGVEWLATEKILVHGNSRMEWGNSNNIVKELSQLNRLLRSHPCFFDGVKVIRLSADGSPVVVLHRVSADGQDAVIVLANSDPDRAQSASFSGPAGIPLNTWVDLLDQVSPGMALDASGKWNTQLAAGAVYCLGPDATPRGMHGDEYRLRRSQAAWAIKALNKSIGLERTGCIDWRVLAARVHQDPFSVLTAIASLGQPQDLEKGHAEPVSEAQLLVAIDRATEGGIFPCVLRWTCLDARRILPVPPEHWLLLQDEAPFRAALDLQDGSPVQNLESIPAGGGHIASIPPGARPGDARLLLERCAKNMQHVSATIRFLPGVPSVPSIYDCTGSGETHLGGAAVQAAPARVSDLVLLTNGRGGMARMCLDLGRVNSKYDCVLGANLHPSLPVDRHILAKRIRVWVNADGFITPLDFRSLATFSPGPPATWDFIANAGDGRTVEIQMRACMLEGSNTTSFRFARPTAARATGKQLPAKADVRLAVRVDIEDRGFHGETKRNGGADCHFNAHTRTLATGAEAADSGLPVGFAFVPAPDRKLQVLAASGAYHPQPEWSENIPHPVEQSRGQVPSGDAFSPGWFELPLPKGAELKLVITAEDLAALGSLSFDSGPLLSAPQPLPKSSQTGGGFEQQLLQAIKAFVVKRGEGRTVIAGYPWFLDWGRDTFICARGLLAAGMTEEVKQITLTFARFVQQGTLPNTLFGDDASNRDTSDAPLWFGMVCSELATAIGPGIYEAECGNGRKLRDVLRDIGEGYRNGTPNGIRMDPQSALVWSPSHFTWMDTNHPAGTPREGYPVEIQALWVRLLSQLEMLAGGTQSADWGSLANRALSSIEQLYWRGDLGWYADNLIAPAGTSAAQATVDDALRSNCLFLASLGLAETRRAQRCVEAALRYLVVPGALRSLAPLQIRVPLPIRVGGRLLNNPDEPYSGRYEGDEDTRRKPAYHNGTAWTWTFPVFCEALARAWSFSPVAVAAAKAYLGSITGLMVEACLGQVPEIVDGDAPHTQRGCDAQAWGATEALRVWKLLEAQKF